MDYKKLYENEQLETQIYSIISNGEDPVDIIRKNNSYEYHYFLSHLRHDLFQWYPFKKEGSILEIGASYGQLTSLFTKKVNDVVAIENTESKCKIISKRAKDATVLLRNFDDLQIDEKFDYIILCNAFEYAKSFVDSKTPYVDYLTYLKGFLKDDGIILIALSNRLGLKYFAGSKEEHSNRFFSGINGFASTDNIQIFSRAELINIINDSGFSNYKFFYPYPNHEFPQVIHTDKLINEIPFVGATEFANDRIHAIDEGTLNLTLSNDNLSQYFANSFLVEIRKSDRDLPTDNIDFVKIHSDREEEFQIYTTIFSDGTVSKTPITAKANNHIKKMFDNSGHMMGKIKCLPCEMKGNSISYDFLRQNSVEDLLVDAIIDDDRTRFFKIIEDFHDALFHNSFESNEYASEEFLKVFKEKSDITFHCHEKSNLDMNFANTFLINGKFTSIDYEWIFDFPIPLEYIFYTSFNYHLYSNNLIREFTSFEEIFNHFNLDTGNMGLFFEWNCNFLRHVLNRPPLTQPKVIHLDKIEENDGSNDEKNQQEIESLKKEIALKNKELEMLRASNSPKATSPLKKFKSILKK